MQTESQIQFYIMTYILDARSKLQPKCFASRFYNIYMPKANCLKVNVK